MKKVKVKFVGFWPGFDQEKFFLTRILKKYYDLEITDNADYIICDGTGFYEYLGYDQVRIMFSGENYVPDFNYIDYGISSYPINFLDRHFSFPGLVLETYDNILACSKKNRDYTTDILQEKTLFANLVAGHESENGIRSKILEKLGQYKRVESAGYFKNNMPDGKWVKLSDGSKYALQRKCKFTFCGESMAHEGFVTEKIFDAFLADSIPIYYGSSTISDIINKDAFINIRDYDSLDAVLQKVIELDTDDEAYLQMLRQPIFAQERYVEDKIDKLERFVCHIFDQPIEKAYRRSALYMPSDYEKRLLKCKKLLHRFYRRIPEMIRQNSQELFWKVFNALLPIKRKIIPAKYQREMSRKTKGR